METRIIKNGEISSTYCHCHGEPRICEKLELKGWDFHAYICSEGLDEIKQKLSKQAVSLKKEELITSPFDTNFEKFAKEALKT